jgi:hypothetical protein
MGPTGLYGRQLAVSDPVVDCPLAHAERLGSLSDFQEIGRLCHCLPFSARPRSDWYPLGTHKAIRIAYVMRETPALAGAS